jgi:dTDP-4-dehydrorhamnose 3,5-epimerase
MIKDVFLKKLDLNFDDRGFLTEVLKETDHFFKPIKQTTYTESYPGVIKAFHWHKKQWDYWLIVKGMAQVVLYDLRDDSPTKGETNVFYLGEKNLTLLVIPPGVAHGYRVLGNQPVGLFYHTTEPCNKEEPDEERIPFDDPLINFDWTTRPR